MAIADHGNVPVKSTTVSVSDPSTSALIAEIDSTQFAAVSPQAQAYRVYWRVGASTAAIYTLEHALSTGLGSTGVRDRTIVFTGSNQSAQYLDVYKIEPGDRLRCRVASSFTGTAAAQISAEPLT